MNASDIRLSKYMSFLLRHQPEQADLVMDGNGWVDMASLVDACVARGHAEGADDVLRVVEENDKRRFEVSDNVTRIRAAQGHSVDLDLGLEPVVPPAKLFHGTVQRSLDQIRLKGLRSMRRTHVHLSADVETARRVGMRRGTPIILRVDAASMHAVGAEFYQASNGVWLTAKVAPQYLQIVGKLPSTPGGVDVNER